MNQFPEAFVQNMRQLLGDSFDEFMAAMQGNAERSIRANRLKIGEESFEGEIVPWAEDGRYVAEDFRPGDDPAHFSGAYYVQDASAMSPAQVIRVKPGEMVLDLCAAPGGKAGQLAAMLAGDGVLVANEPDAGRCKALAGNLERLGVRNALVTCALPEQLAKKWPGRFDAILVDAPCSGEGMFRRDDAARAQWSEGSPAGCAARQAEILDQAAKMVRPGGRIVYSTCTFNELENEGTVGGFLERNDEFRPVDFELAGVGKSEGGMLRLWPHRLRGEGHFVAMLAKAGEGEEREGSGGVNRKNPEAFDWLRRDLPGSWPEKFTGWTIMKLGDTLHALPPELPEFDGLKVQRIGLHLCKVGNNYVKPDHALAMALSPGEVRSHEIDLAQAHLFMRGHELRCDEALTGWVLVAHRGLPLGWGKAVQGTIKNHVPKGVRLLEK